jgi:tetratricopeptide (TPR) repeat protein
VVDRSRIEELQRRVRSEPGSIAFAQLAEEHRRIREYQEAIQICREGLQQHPGYVSARVTLGRALMETGQHEEARAELESVLRTAPDNLAAIRALAEIRGSGIGAQGSTASVSMPIPDSVSFSPDPRSPIPDPVVAALEGWLAAIVADREARRSAHEAGDSRNAAKAFR